MDDLTFFDTHTHYDDDRFKNDAEQVIINAYTGGVRYILNAGSDLFSSVKSIEFSEKYDFIFAAVGVHPHEVGKLENNDLKKIEELLLHPKVVAVGEIGLDYYYNYSPKDIQQKWFVIQLNIAKNLKLPVVIHNREAHEDVMRIVKSEFPSETGGVFHCFSGSWEMAKELLKKGFYISIGGPITFKNARRIIEVVKSVPMDMLLLETDCPYLTPEPFRGKRNDSSYIRFIAEKVAEIKAVSLEEVAKATTENAKRLFKIK